jgi:putative transcriptional regulator
MLFIEDNLEGKILIASPTLDKSSYFSKTLVYVLRHSIEGAVGLVINKPLPKLEGNLVVKHEGENIPLEFKKAYSGGPVEIEKGFVLHLDERDKLDSDPNPIIRLSFDVRLLKAVAKGKLAAKNSLFLFGYCGWSMGQLEEEVEDNDWIVARPNEKIIFDGRNTHKWDKYLSMLSINPSQYVDCTGTC